MMIIISMIIIISIIIIIIIIIIVVTISISNGILLVCVLCASARRALSMRQSMAYRMCSLTIECVLLL
jgi:hypothetical protein